MLKHRVSRLAVWAGLGAALLLSAGCSSSKPYTLIAQILPVSQSGIVVATIDVSGGACYVRVMTAASAKPWAPACTVVKDQSGFKSFSIAGTQVDFGAVPNGFKVLSATLPELAAPAVASTAASASALTKPGAKSQPVAQATATTTPVVTPTFPDEWSLAPYPGHVSLQGQNIGFLITSAKLNIQGSDGQLDVTFKASYSPLHLDCTVTTNAHGDFNLIFNPAEVSKLTGGGNYSIQLVSEGTSITGNIWDSHGFDSWTPSLPPQWVATAVSSD